MHFLILTALVTIGMQLSFFAVAATCKFDLLTDFAGGLNFMALAILSFVDGGHFHTRQAVITAIVLVCRAELGLFLLFRVCKRGSDARFDEIRGKFLSFLGFWVFQMIWVWGVSLAFMFLNYEEADPDWEARDTVGVIMACVGFVFQFVADLQKYAFRANPDNKGKVCDAGLWKISRHPNYIGEMLIWWGVFISTASVFDASGRNWGYVTIISPILTMLILLFLSGMPSAEGSSLSKYMKTQEQAETYLAYRNRTPILIPFPPPLYARTPMWIKRAFCFEWPMYDPPAPSEVKSGDSGGSAKSGDDGGSGYDDAAQP